MDPKAIANGTVATLEKGFYMAPDGSKVDIADLLATCVKNTRLYTPGDLTSLCKKFLGLQKPQPSSTFSVVNETTLQGCARLIATQNYQHIGVLNFASAKNPGGGFLRGARAQEESLARSSGLYSSLLECPEYYEFHRSQKTCLYSDHMIYSPECPVFRNDAGAWLPKPYVVDFITSPAPNAGVIYQNEPHNCDNITPTLVERAGKILALAAYHQCDALILGAWGCGVFRNDPSIVAKVFYDLLGPDGLHKGYFQHVAFSVYDTSSEQNTYAAFARQFESMTG
jgi:uncharacterized protein (TIGR02452 family)